MKKKLIVLVFCSLLSACLGGYSQPARFYTLSAVSETPLSGDRDISLGINRVQTAQYLDRPQIITKQDKTNEVLISENNRWIESLPNIIGHITAKNLSVLLPKGQIKVKSFTTEKFDYTLSLDVIKMDTIPNMKTTLEVWWQIKDKDRKTVLQQKFEQSAPVGKNYDDITHQQSILFGKMAEQIADNLIKLK